mgnify:FL=1|jgi:hypothetical protein
MAKNAELASIEFKETEVQLSDELAVYYSNFSSFSISNPDLTIDFGLRDSRVINKKNVSVATIQSRVIMSPQQAKVFSEKLNGLIELYEKTYGEINTAPKVDNS